MNPIYYHVEFRSMSDWKWKRDDDHRPEKTWEEWSHDFANYIKEMATFMNDANDKSEDEEYLSTIQKVDLGRSYLRSFPPRLQLQFPMMKTLTYLDLSDNRLLDIASVSYLLSDGTLANTLQHLDLQRQFLNVPDSMNDQFQSFLSNHKHMKNLFLNGNYVGNAIIESLKQTVCVASVRGWFKGDTRDLDLPFVIASIPYVSEFTMEVYDNMILDQLLQNNILVRFEYTFRSVEEFEKGIAFLDSYVKKQGDQCTLKVLNMNNNQEAEEDTMVTFDPSYDFTTYIDIMCRVIKSCKFTDLTLGDGVPFSSEVVDAIVETMSPHQPSEKYVFNGHAIINNSSDDTTSFVFLDPDGEDDGRSLITNNFTVAVAFRLPNISNIEIEDNFTPEKEQLNFINCSVPASLQNITFLDYLTNEEIRKFIFAQRGQIVTTLRTCFVLSESKNYTFDVMEELYKSFPNCRFYLRGTHIQFSSSLKGSENTDDKNVWIRTMMMEANRHEQLKELWVDAHEFVGHLKYILTNLNVPLARMLMFKVHEEHVPLVLTTAAERCTEFFEFSYYGSSETHERVNEQVKQINMTKKITWNPYECVVHIVLVQSNNTQSTNTSFLISRRGYEDRGEVVRVISNNMSNPLKYKSSPHDLWALCDDTVNLAVGVKRGQSDPTTAVDCVDLYLRNQKDSEMEFELPYQSEKYQWTTRTIRTNPMFMVVLVSQITTRPSTASSP